MEKKPNVRCLNQANSKGLVSESKKSQDVSGKQWPRNGRRRENPNCSSSKSEPIRNKTMPSNKLRNNFDKRPRNRGGYQGNNMVADQSTGLNDDLLAEAELNSVFKPGSKKQNLNHLLNFHYAPRDRDPPVLSKSGNNRNFVKKIRYNKEQFLQANCQFVVKSNEDYGIYLGCADTLVQWNLIEQIHIQSSEDPQCPICLFPPVAGKMTRCGHVFCFPCILHYLALSDKVWRKCPICYESINMDDLKSTISKPHTSYSVGDMIKFQLMCREKGSLVVKNANEINGTSKLHHMSDPENVIKHSKLLLANEDEILTIILRERYELEEQLLNDGTDCPESIFVQQALNYLMNREENLSKAFMTKPSNIDVLEDKMSQMNTNYEENKVIAHKEIEEASGYSDKDNSYIDDEETLELHDVQIPIHANDPSKYYYFYQAYDGQNLYLHSVNIKMLQLMYGSLENAPETLIGKIIQKESCSMKEELRKRLRYLQHLPVTCQFDVAEIQMQEPLVSAEVLHIFKDELRHRHNQRLRRKREEFIREKRIDKVNDLQMGKSWSPSANIDIESNSDFPLCGIYDASPLASGSREDTSFLNNLVREDDFPQTSSYRYASSSSSNHSGPSFAKMLVTSSKETWPSISKPPAALALKVKTSTIQPMKNTSESDDGDSDFLRPPDYRLSFSKAIAEALENHSSQGVVNETSKIGKKKNKKNKNTLLFSTGIAFNGN